jgi:hypothetical protein
MAALRFGRWQQEGGTVLLARIFIAAALFTLIPSIAFGQCSGNFPANTLCGTVTGGVPRAIAAPLSVSNADGSLTIGPTTGSVIGSLNVAHANSFSATQTFSNVIDTNLISGGTQCVQATAAGLLVGTGAVCGSGGGGGGVTSVNNSDGSLTVISPTGPAVTISLALNHANTWTAVQSITNGDLSLLGATSGNTLLEASAVAGAGTIATFPANTGTVAELNFAQTWTAAQTFNAGAPSLVVTQTGSVSSNDTPPANLVKMGDPVFMGDAVNKSGNSSCAGTDWFTVFQGNTLPNGVCGYGGNILLVEASATNSGATSAILGAGQTKNQTAGGAFGVKGFALQNSSTLGGGGGAGGAWASYFECDYIVSNSVGCIGQEIEVGNFIGDSLALSGGVPPDPYGQSPITSSQVGCGSGIQYLGVGSFKCGAAINIVNASALGSTTGFWVGLNFLINSVSSQTLFGGGTHVAVAFPSLYSLVWYSSHNTPQGGFEFDASGNLQIGLNGTIILTNGAGVGLASGVDCPAGTVNIATLAFGKGIATHC